MKLSASVQIFKQWMKGVRLYIAIAAAFITAQVYWWTKSVYGDSSVATIRLQEIYAWIAVGLLLITLSIGPAYKIFERLPGKLIMRDARRLLGVSAAWFASLHVLISYIDQFQAANPLQLPNEFKFGFSLGAIALIILWALAATSFDAAFRKLGVWWFRLHRLIYLAVPLILLHAFAIGVHATNGIFISALVIVVGLLFAAHFYLSFGPNGRQITKLQSFTLSYGLVLTAAIFLYGATK